MQTKTAGMWRVGAMLLAGSLAACTVDKQDAPALIGPGGSAQQVQISASPDRLAHNGSAQSVVTLSVTNESGQPVAGQRVSLGASTGTLSLVDVVTGADGRATVIVTAPALSTPAASISVFATPFGTNAANALTRNLTITLTGTPANTTAPTASFSFAPATPVAGGSMVFDASATTDEGHVCGDVCTYTWDFGGLGAGVTDGRVVARNALSTGTYAVTVTVRDNAGTVSSVTRSVTVAAPAAPPT
jgi:invasin-like protein/PKD domain-containing protein